MKITKWDPFNEMALLSENLNKFFNRFFNEGLIAPKKSIFQDEIFKGTWNPDVDIYENKDSIIVKADLPGIQKDKIKVEVKDNVLTIHGERKEEKEINEKNVYRVERQYGEFYRSFALPAKVDASKITAKYKDGILEVTLPKPEETKGKEIKVEVE
jgi:HSP20 family protein